MNTTAETQVKDISDLTTDELEALLSKRKAAEKSKQEKERKAYLADKDGKTENILRTASALFKELGEFKQYCHIEMDKQAVALANYGEIRSTSKGGFSITHSDGTMQVTRRRDTEPTWDERSTKAIELIKEFLGDAIKKRDIKMYEILMSFLERNENGDLEYSRVMDLYKHEDKFDDPRWKEGLRLIKESYTNHLKGYGYVFKQKDEHGKWQTIVLNFSSI
jgi:Protein of unknown function (DUF3164)